MGNNMSSGRVASHGSPQFMYPPNQQYYAHEVVREIPYQGEHQYGGMAMPPHDVREQHYGGMVMPPHYGGIGYDYMANSSSYHGDMMMNGGARAVSNYYTSSPIGPSCGPKKEFERVLLNPQSTSCSKPVTSMPPIAAPPPSCDNTCTSAQFVLQPANAC